VIPWLVEVGSIAGVVPATMIVSPAIEDPSIFW